MEGGSLTFGALLRKFRRVAGLSQEALAERACVSVETVGALERGARRAPYRVTVTGLAAALGLTKEEHEQLQAAARRPRGQRTELSHNLPWDLDDLIGRDQLASELGDLVATYRLVTLVGSGGVGKTSLALRVAHEVLPAWPDGAWLVELAAAHDEHSLLTMIASTIGAHAARADALLPAVIARLRERRMLLVLDGCERIVGCVAPLAGAILRGSPNVHVLATSRERLSIGGERAYRVPALAMDDAVALFVERARQADPRFALTPGNAALVADVCRRLDGLPLAIELAAARMKAINLHSLARRLDDRFQILGDGSRDAVAHHRTMRALLDWSFAILSYDERVLFTRMAVFAEGCTMDSIEGVCGGAPLERTGILPLLSSLVEKSLVLGDPAGESMVYRLLESTRCYALEKLQANGEREALERRLAMWIANIRAS